MRSANAGGHLFLANGLELGAVSMKVPLLKGSDERVGHSRARDDATATTSGRNASTFGTKKKHNANLKLRPKKHVLIELSRSTFQRFQVQTSA